MQDARTRPVVYFDGGCPVCRREIAHYRGRPGAEGVEWVDLTACDDAALPEGLTREAALARMYVLGADGRLASGARAFAVLWRALPGWRLLGRVVGSWPVAPVAELAYRSFLVLRRAWR
ncbi:thiol-disulfide oxidoreductase DCC family protein [Elioraea rosea]|uniref:thiol-disulfide oxidoreductase DCC family protein n=1 Tax=Elioraea rosea TaxID=2492390 RepID=UPI0011841818|nr:DUF393 domain-containing protein [Elioraea rosea]